jgi:hypothetical protein
MVEAYRQAIGAADALAPGERLYKGPLAAYKPVTPEHGKPAEDATLYDVPHLPGLNEDNVPPLPDDLPEEVPDDDVLMYEFADSFCRGAGWDGEGQPDKQKLIAGYEAWASVEDEVTSGDADHRELGERMGAGWARSRGEAE